MHLTPNPRTFGSFQWLSWYAIALDKDLKALYEYVADRPLARDSEMVIHTTSGAVTTY